MRAARGITVTQRVPQGAHASSRSRQGAGCCVATPPRRYDVSYMIDMGR